MKEINKKILKPISLTPETMEYIEKSDWLMRNYKDPESVKKFNRLVFNAYMDADTNGDGLPDTWWNWKNKGSLMHSSITASGALRIENSGNNWGAVATRKFSLQPDKKYILEMRIKGELINKDNTFNVHVLSEKGKFIQSKISVKEIENIEKDYIFEFTTAKDIDDAKQYVRLDHMGNNTGYVEISRIVLYEVE
jgi:hypothetical protein